MPELRGRAKTLGSDGALELDVEGDEYTFTIKKGAGLPVSITTQHSQVKGLRNLLNILRTTK